MANRVAGIVGNVYELIADDEDLHMIYTQLGVTPESLERDVAQLQEWLSKQPHLPFPGDARRLRLCLLYSKNSLEDSKRLLDLFYSVRAAAPEFFKNRDPLSPELEQCARTVCVAPLPRLTAEGYRIHVFRLLDTDPNHFHAQHYLKWSFMTGEVRLLEDISLESVCFLDLQGVTLSHLSKLTFPLVRKYAYCGQNVFMTRLKQIHVVNPPAFAEKIMSLFKPFLKEKIVKRICVHKSYDKLLEYFSKDVLPEDYGGTLPPLKVLSDEWSAKIVSYRNWFLKEDNVHADESKRPGKNSLDPDIFGIDGSFRKLEID